MTKPTIEDEWDAACIVSAGDKCHIIDLLKKMLEGYRELKEELADSQNWSEYRQRRIKQLEEKIKEFNKIVKDSEK